MSLRIPSAQAGRWREKRKKETWEVLCRVYSFFLLFFFPIQTCPGIKTAGRRQAARR